MAKFAYGVGLWTKVSLLVNIVLLYRLHNGRDLSVFYAGISEVPCVSSDALLPASPAAATKAPHPSLLRNLTSSCQHDYVDPFRERHNYIAPSPRNASASAECGASPDFGPFFAQDMKKRSRLEEDKVIYNMFFRNAAADRPHTYVEIGGFDGKTESNSRFFDVCLGWEGLLVEANPTTFKKLVANRPSAHKASFAASCTEEEARNNKTVGFHDVIFSNAAQVDTSNGDAYKGRPKKPIQVPCGPLTPLLVDLFCGHVSFFSLDVEGAEPMVLESIDFSQVFIEVFIVENSNNFCQAKCESRDKFRSILLNNNYELFRNKVTKSDLFVHKKSHFMTAMKR